MLIFQQQTETPSDDKSKLTRQCIRHQRYALTLQILTECLTTLRGHTLMDGLRGTSKWHTRSPLPVARPRKPLCCAGFVAKQKHQTQTPTLMWEKQKERERQRRGKTKIGPEAIKKPNFRVC